MNMYTKCVKGGKMKTAKEIGIYLKKLRGSKSQEEVAKDLHLSVSAISMYEQGERIPRDEIKVRIAEYYKKSVQDIFF